MIKCSVCVLTYNSGQTLERCLQSVRDLAEILILDGGSTDKTIEIAKKFGARVLPQSETPGMIVDFTLIRQRSFSLAQEDWRLWLDSDEWLSEDLKNEVAKAVNGKENILYSFSRKAVINGRIIDYLYCYPEYCCRLFNKNGGAVLKKGKKVHESLVPGPGTEIKKIDAPLYHNWHEDYKFLIKKDDYYLDLSVLGKRGILPWKKLKIVVINVLKAVKVFLKSVWLYMMYGFKHTLPIRYSWRFMRYHLIYAKKIIKL